MKGRSLILSMTVLGLALSGPLMAADNSDLRAALRADAQAQIESARSAHERPSGLELGVNLTAAEFAAIAGQPMALPAPETVQRLAKTVPQEGEEGDAGDAPDEPATLSGLVVYIGNR
jgi:hypothetical protein